MMGSFVLCDCRDEQKKLTGLASLFMLTTGIVMIVFITQDPRHDEDLISHISTHYDFRIAFLLH
jgi:hypothetical protein